MEGTGEFPRVIEKTDLEPSPPEVGGTKIILQRHGKYERNDDNLKIGSLTEEGIQSTHDLGRDFFHKLLESVPEQERSNIDFLVVASDTQYKGGGLRSMETADQIMKSLREELLSRGLKESQILNSSGKYRGEKGPRPMTKLREPQMLDNSPEFVEFLKERYGDKTLDFWIAFEEDTHKEEREKMGAEGPDEITDRLKMAVDVLSEYSKRYHKHNPNRRLIIWSATHYDTISPYVKREVFGESKELPLGVDYGAGIAIELNSEGKASTKIAGKDYILQSDN